MDEEKISDGGETFIKEERLTYRDIVLKQLQKVINNSSKEMKKGFYVESYPVGGSGPSVITKYVGDTRNELMNSINALHDVLQPRFDEDMKKKSEDLNKKIKAAKNYEGDKISIAKLWKIALDRYRDLFQEICLFLERKEWFVTADTED